MKKVNWWKKFWGQKLIVRVVDCGLKEDELLIHGHSVYVTKEFLKKHIIIIRK